MRVTLPKSHWIFFCVPTRQLWWLETQTKKLEQKQQQCEENHFSRTWVILKLSISKLYCILGRGTHNARKSTKNPVSRTIKINFQGSVKGSVSFFYIMKYYLWDFCVLAWRKLYKKPVRRTEGRLSFPLGLCFPQCFLSVLLGRAWGAHNLLKCALLSGCISWLVVAWKQSCYYSYAMTAIAGLQLHKQLGLDRHWLSRFAHWHKQVPTCESDCLNSGSTNGPRPIPLSQGCTHIIAQGAGWRWNLCPINSVWPGNFKPL